MLSFEILSDLLFTILASFSVKVLKRSVPRNFTENSKGVTINLLYLKFTFITCVEKITDGSDFLRTITV